MTDDAVKWVTIADAVIALGKSDRTLRRWVAGDKLPHKREQGRILVDISEFIDDIVITPIGDDIGASMPDAEPDIADDKASDIDTLIELAELRKELKAKGETIDRQQTEIDFLRETLEREQSLVLSAQQKLIEAVTDERDKERRRWWEFWK